ncbi:MAG: hypothetical protein QXG39_00970 [Candidatus Aenigmatarchaeota archaeon]
MGKIIGISLALILLTCLPSLSSAQNPFLEMVEKFRLIGVFDMFLFLFFFLVFYALLAKSKILGGSVGLNGVVAVIAAFFLTLYSTFTGFSLIEPLSRFFTQVGVIGLMFIVGLVVASIFYPDLPRVLAEHIKGTTLLYIMIPIALALLITSRSIWVLWAGYKATPGMSSDIMILVVGLIIFVVVLLIAALIGGRK